MDDEMERAQLLISEMDAICEACSTIKNSISQKDIQETDERDDYSEEEEKFEPDLEGHTITVLDKNHEYEYFTVKVVHKSNVQTIFGVPQVSLQPVIDLKE